MDVCVAAVNSGDNNVRQQALQVLGQLKQDPDMLSVIQTIILNSQSAQTKFYTFSILHEIIKTRWQILTSQDKENIKNSVGSQVLSYGGDENIMRNQKFLINKINETLIAIVKQEWDKTWKTFVGDLCSAARGSELQCENCMAVMKLLSEEIFDFSKGKVLSKELNILKSNMTEQFSPVFQLCAEILSMATQSNTVGAPLVKATLSALQHFLSWVPVGYIFETEIIF